MKHNPLTYLRKHRLFKLLALSLAANFLVELLFPTAALALTSGPSHPEVQSFEPVGTSEMVNLFSGDFTYNIPLFELPGPNGGYPFNMAYHSGISMDQEASWVGLGWNINPGAINRQMRGLPDDFRGDKINRKLDMKPNWTAGISANANIEVFGADAAASFGTGLSIYYNNYRGVGYSLSPNFGLKAMGDKAGVGATLGLSLDSQEGVGVNGGISFTDKNENSDQTYSLGVGINSASGLKANAGVSNTRKRKFYLPNLTGLPKLDNMFFVMRKRSGSGSSSMTFSNPAYTPAVSMSTRGQSLSLSFKVGGEIGSTHISLSKAGFFNTTYLPESEKDKDVSAYGYQYHQSAGDEDLTDVNRASEGVVRKSTINLGAPSQTYDYYSIQGQGTGGMFRPYRNELAVVGDPTASSLSYGGSFGFEVSAGVDGQHLGYDGGFSYSKSESGMWKDVLASGAGKNPWEAYYRYGHGYENDEINDPNFETIYYKIHGEHTAMDPDEMDFIGGDAPVRVNLQENGSMFTKHWVPVLNDMIDNQGNDVLASASNFRAKANRVVRRTSVQPMTNAQLGRNDEVLGEYQVQYFDQSSLSTPNDYHDPSEMQDYNNRDVVNGLDRGAHHAGFTNVDPNGLRYTYALPVYNTKQVDHLFSVGAQANDCSTRIPLPMNSANDDVDYKVTSLSGSESFRDRKEIPGYAYSYLLTSVLGTDYVDADNIPGPSDGDYGYWVKFNYLKTSDQYRWRAPLAGANYMAGLESKATDNKGSYSYGEREVYYLASAETKTHVAVFETCQREDGVGVLSEYNKSENELMIDATNLDAQSYKLNKVKLYKKDDYQSASATPIQTVHFEYDYSLCPNTLNRADFGDNCAIVPGSGSGEGAEGKLTLKKLWFTYENNDRGALSPYEFEYSSTNPSYSDTRYDRWGSFKDESDCENLDFPFTRQFNETVVQSEAEKEAFRNLVDANASAWHMEKIHLPTGGTIAVKYEADDYAYVQNRVANQMFHIKDVGTDDNGCSNANEFNVYDGGTDKGAGQDDRRVYFELEHPIPTNAANPKDMILNDYLKPIERHGKYQVYYKIKSNLRDGIWEDVSGYANVDLGATDEYGVSTSCIVTIGGQDYYTRGFVTLEKMDVNGSVDYHPFAVAAWQHMRTTDPSLLTTIGNLDQTPGSTQMERARKAKSLLSIFYSSIQMFVGYRNLAFSRNFAQKIDAGKSYIRLGTPDRVKIGGGVRVRELTISDNWNSMTGEADAVYGQVYDYTTTEEVNGEARVISSGVAVNEPHVGGSENALRYAKQYTDHIMVKTDNSLFQEFPVNEGYYPGAAVGYSKVTVRSKNTGEVMDSGNFNNGDLTTATGVTEHEFYTARDFPVLTEETAIKTEPHKLWLPIPLIGMIKRDQQTSAQGYVIELNDMHGKPKSVKSFGLDRFGELMAESVSSTRNVYKSVPAYANGRPCQKLDNLVDVLEGEYDPDLANINNGKFGRLVSQKLLGTEYEMVMDMRRSHGTSISAGINSNNDILAYWLPTYVPWPSFNYMKNDLRTAVNNKIIHKSGVVRTVVTTNGEATATVQNELWDAQTGQVLLSSVKNDYDNPIYSYTQPARWEYSGTDAASKNFGMSFTIELVPVADADGFFTVQHGVHGVESHVAKPQGGASAFSITELSQYLEPGDEFIITDPGPTANNKSSATLIQKIPDGSGGTNLLFHSDDVALQAQGTTTARDLQFFLSRSGKRNLLNSTVASIVALEDPTFRYKYDLPTSNQAVEVDDLVAFLNDQIDCDGRLPVKTYNFLSDPDLVDVHGQPKYPSLAAGIEWIKLRLQNPNQTECPNAACDGNGPSDKGYSIQFKQINKELPVDCKCIARFSDANTALGYAFLKDFVHLGNGVIQANYSNRASTEFCSCLGTTPVSPYVVYAKEVLQASAVELNDDWDYNLLPPCDNLSAYGNNPYADGRKGIWRPWKDHYYKDKRFQTSGMDLSHDGVYDGDGTNKHFYAFNWLPTHEQPRPEEWVAGNTVTKYNKDGYAIENRDINGFYSSSQFGYDNMLSKAVGANMRYNAFFAESFDDPTSAVIANLISPYASFKVGQAHTGTSSLKVSGAGVPNVKTGIHVKPGEELLVSAWIAKDPDAGFPDSYTYALDATDPSTQETCGLEVSFYDDNGNQLGNTQTVVPTGKLVEGWQRIEGKVTVPVNATVKDVHIGFKSGKYNNVVLNRLWDDIRVYPAEGSLQTYVYDAANFRLKAVLNEQNYATFYEYDEEGKLFLTRQESSEGIMTTQESRTHIQEAL